ncbi:MAG TPA: MDR family MFS transporter [Candidatus Obscuribacterales bacterium]
MKDKGPDKGPEEQWHPALPPGQTFMVFGGMLLVILLAALDQTIVSTALPKIVGELHGFEYYSWVATIYMLASTITVPIYGKLSDLFGRKYILLFGIAVFLAGSAWCGAATSMLTLIAARGVQGLGAGALLPVVFATMGHLYSPRDLGKYNALVAAAFVLASVIGPPIGGYITDDLSWRWVFYVNVPLGILAAAVIVALMPAFKSDKPRVRIDFVGAGLLMTGLSLVLLWVDGASALTAMSVEWVRLMAGVGVAMLGVFVWHQYRTAEPLMDPRLLIGNRVVLMSGLITMVTGVTMIGMTYYMPLFFQAVLGYSATGSGNLMLPISVASGIGSVISGWLAARSGRYRWNTLTGALVLNAGLAFLLFNLGTQASIAGIVIATSVMGLGLGVGVSLYGTIVRNAVALSQMGQAQAGLTLFRQIGSTFGMAMCGALMNAEVNASGAINIDAITKPAFITGLQHIYVAVFALSLVATVLVFFLKEIPLRSASTDE